MNGVKLLNIHVLLIFFVSAWFSTHAEGNPQGTSDNKLFISNILLIGNKTTHERIIKRELIFEKGDSVTLDELEGMIRRSRENLMNTQLFNFVDINMVKETRDRVEVVIIMTERWYIFPIPIFEVIDRNFNEWWKTRSIARTVYGLQIKWENFRGRNESLRISLRFGYTENVSLYYNIPYINRDQTTGLTFYAGMSRNHEVGYSLNNNKVNFYKNTGRYIKHDFTAGMKLYHRKAIHQTTGVFMEYKNNAVNDTIVSLNNEFYQPGMRKQQMINLGVQYRLDYRDYVEYPLRGYYFDFEAVKQGLGFMKGEPDQIYLTSSFKKYVELRKRWHIASGLKAKISGQRYAAFANTRALGYTADFVRGYEYYVINGQNFLLFKTNLKFTLLPVKILQAKYIPSEKFSIIPFSIHLNAYLDGAYVRDRQYAYNNALANSWLLGYGLGIDFVTYYNIILRTEYSFNRRGEGGFFIHFAAPI